MARGRCNSVGVREGPKETKTSRKAVPCGAALWTGDFPELPEILLGPLLSLLYQ